MSVASVMSVLVMYVMQFVYSNNEQLLNIQRGRQLSANRKIYERNEF